MTVRAVLFDVGGPLDLEIAHEARVDARMIEACAECGITVRVEDLARASENAVAAFAPNAYAAMLFELSGRDRPLAGRVLERFRNGPQAERPPGIELRPGIGELLEELHSRGLRLGLAANQPARILEDLDSLGIGRFFSHRQVSGHHGFHKPDVRLFLEACRDLRVEPAETIMVGDRIDNDIVPAKLLGMTAVLLRTGRHISQQPRSLEEFPDAEVSSVPELREALVALLSR